VYNVARTKT